MWGGPEVLRTEAEAEDLVEIMEDYNLTSTLAPGTITYEEGERQATIDLCLVTLGLAYRVIRSQSSRVFDVSVKQLNREPSRNWKPMDEKRFKSCGAGEPAADAKTKDTKRTWSIRGGDSCSITKCNTNGSAPKDMVP
ncbi:hypothetical protein MAA_11830 [Metarhizium robertsii ARSEF 23]|uniref:Uncharacterized protein n=1 Tax=Metarhizium robertsii (strain ARSEF 23 / ATCC MYA-3075) TaxID=655844 RepID=A0A0B2XEV6_METRA|nr:uncharacterized protein MAA_11830 [Metarhizium robertsii ARSEF 23]KHO10569.1 hypothetical protein MAA_11830 [Metarhizium robertsii ARSEF 23]